MNKKGNVFLNTTIAIFVWLTGIRFIPYIISVIDVTRTDISCSSTVTAFGVKLICLNIDLIVPYIIWTLVVIVLGLMTSND